MIVYIDDIRDPARFLPGVEVVWIKEFWEARNFIFDHNTEITEIHFDNQLDDPNYTGMDIFTMVAFDCMWGDKNQDWPVLSKIYLHTSDRDVILDAIEKYGDGLKAAGVELINNSLGW